jgi:hypothetical protein
VWHIKIIACRVFKVSTKTILGWVAKEGKEFKQLGYLSKDKFVSCDEIW